MELVRTTTTLIFIALTIIGCKKESADNMNLSVHYRNIKGCERNCDEITVSLKNNTQTDILLFYGKVALSPELYEFELRDNIVVDSSYTPSYYLQDPPKEPPVWLNKPLLIPDTFIFKQLYPESNKLFERVIKECKDRITLDDVYFDIYLEGLSLFFNESIFLRKDSTCILKFRYNLKMSLNDSTAYKLKVSYFDNEYGINFIQEQINFIQDSLKVDIPAGLDGYKIWSGKLEGELKIGFD